MKFRDVFRGEVGLGATSSRDQAEGVGIGFRRGRRTWSMGLAVDSQYSSAV